MEHNVIEFNDNLIQSFTNDYINVSNQSHDSPIIEHQFIDNNGNNNDKLGQLHQKVLKHFKKNNKINNQLRQLCQNLITTFNVIIPCFNYHIIESMNLCKITHKTPPPLIEPDMTIKEYYAKLKNYYMTTFILEISNTQAKMNDYFEKVPSESIPNCIATLNKHASCIKTIIQLSDRRLVSGGVYGNIRFWNVTSYECEATINAHMFLKTSLIELQNAQLASWGYETVIKLWDVTLYQCIAVLSIHNGYVYSLIQLLDGRLLSSRKNELKVWNIDTLKCIKTIEGHLGCINSVIQLHNENIDSGGSGTLIKIWNISSFVCERMLQSSFCIDILMQLLDGKLVSCQNETIKIRNVANSQCLMTISQYTMIRSITQLSDGRVAVGCFDARIVIYNSTSWKPISNLKSHSMSVNSIL